MCPLVAAADPIQLPDSARPGAVRPQEVGKPTTPPKPAPEVVPSSTGETMKIPPVINRPLNPHSGQRLVVKEFRLVGAQDLPEFDVKLADVKKLLAEQVSKKPQGFTVGEMQSVADAVTQYYRKKGLILAHAVVPVQTVTSDVVDIRVYVGILGRVLTEGNKMYSAATLKAPFKRLIGKPVDKAQIESALLQLTDFPGLTVFGVFQPGQLVGQADIVLRVQEEKHLDISLRADNEGLSSTGDYRFRPTVTWNNVTGGADKLTFTVQQTYRPKKNFYESIEYQHYLTRGITAGVFINRNDFDVGGNFASQHIKGLTTQKGLWFEKSWIRSRRLNISTRMELDLKKSKTRLRGQQSNRDRLTVVSLQGNFDNVDTRFKGIDFASVDYERGLNNVFGAMGSPASALLKPQGWRPGRQGGDGRYAGGQFEKWFVTGSRLQTITPNLTFLGRFEFQWSDDLLVPMEQYSVGGPDNVRAFAPAHFLLDKALFFSAELIQRMPFITNKVAFGGHTWGDLVQGSIFYDEAIGRLNDPLSSEPNSVVNFKGAGLQLRFNIPGSIDSRLIVAWPVGNGTGPGKNNGKKAGPDFRRPQIWGDLTYSF